MIIVTINTVIIVSTYTKWFFKSVDKKKYLTGS